MECTSYPLKNHSGLLKTFLPFSVASVNTGQHLFRTISGTLSSFWDVYCSFHTKSRLFWPSWTSHYFQLHECSRKTRWRRCMNISAVKASEAVASQMFWNCVHVASACVSQVNEEHADAVGLFLLQCNLMRTADVDYNFISS